MLSLCIQPVTCAWNVLSSTPSPTLLLGSFYSYCKAQLQGHPLPPQPPAHSRGLHGLHPTLLSTELLTGQLLSLGHGRLPRGGPQPRPAQGLAHVTSPVESQPWCQWTCRGKGGLRGCSGQLARSLAQSGGGAPVWGAFVPVRTPRLAHSSPGRTHAEKGVGGLQG